MDDADEEARKLRTASLFAVAGLFITALTAGLTGLLAVACGVMGSIALATAAVIAFAPGPSDDGEWQASGPPEDGIGTAAEPQQAVRLHVDAPKSVQRWLERVERSAEADAAKRGR
jgi:hypothetical protein